MKHLISISILFITVSCCKESMKPANTNYLAGKPKAKYLIFNNDTLWRYAFYYDSLSHNLKSVYVNDTLYAEMCDISLNTMLMATKIGTFIFSRNNNNQITSINSGISEIGFSLLPNPVVKNGLLDTLFQYEEIHPVMSYRNIKSYDFRYLNGNCIQSTISYEHTPVLGGLGYDYTAYLDSTQYTYTDIPFYKYINLQAPFSFFYSDIYNHPIGNPTEYIDGYGILESLLIIAQMNDYYIYKPSVNLISSYEEVRWATKNKVLVSYELDNMNRVDMAKSVIQNHTDTLYMKYEYYQ